MWIALALIVTFLVSLQIGYMIGGIYALFTVFGHHHTCDGCHKLVKRTCKGGESFVTLYRADGTFADLCIACCNLPNMADTAQGKVQGKFFKWKFQLFPLKNQ